LLRKLTVDVKNTNPIQSWQLPHEIKHISQICWTVQSSLDLES